MTPTLRRACITAVVTYHGQQVLVLLAQRGRVPDRVHSSDPGVTSLCHYVVNCRDLISVFEF
jgi:hypothetical protein